MFSWIDLVLGLLWAVVFLEWCYETNKLRKADERLVNLFLLTLAIAPVAIYERSVGAPLPIILTSWQLFVIGICLVLGCYSGWKVQKELWKNSDFVPDTHFAIALASLVCALAALVAKDFILFLLGESTGKW